MARLRAHAGRRQVVVTTTPGLASLWLIPRLAGFTRHHPGVDVRIDAVFTRRDLQDWQPWLVAMGVPELEPAGTLTFSNYDDVIRAALHGHGIAMGRRPLVDSLIAQGRLVVPMKAELASTRAFFVIVAPSSAIRPEVQAFERWLIRGAGNSSSSANGSF